jgi:hypothetical protein
MCLVLIFLIYKFVFAVLFWDSGLVPNRSCPTTHHLIVHCMAPIGWRVRRLLHDQISTTKVSPLTPPISPRHRQQQQQQQQPTMTIMMTTRGLPNSTTTAAAAAAMFAASRTVAMTTMGVVTTTLPPSTHGGDNRQRIANRISVMAVGASLCFLCHVGLQLTWGNMFTRQASQRCMSHYSPNVS